MDATAREHYTFFLNYSTSIDAHQVAWVWCDFTIDLILRRFVLSEVKVNLSFAQRADKKSVLRFGRSTGNGTR